MRGIRRVSRISSPVRSTATTSPPRSFLPRIRQTSPLTVASPDWMRRDDTPDKPLPFFAESQSNRKAYLWFAWLRSPDASDSYGFCSVNTSGTAGSYIASFSLGVAPGFRVGIKAKTAEPAQD